MSHTSYAVTYTSVYTDFEPGRVFWGADEELSDGGPPRVIVYGYDGLPMLPVAPPSPNYIPGPEEPHTPPAPQDEDEHEPMFIQPLDPDFVPEPIYPEYKPLEDEYILLAEEQPLPPVTSTSFPPEAEVERLLAMPTPSPSTLTLLSPPFTGERLARCTAPAALPSPPLPPSLYPPPPVDRSRYEVGESSARGRGVDYGFADTVEAEMRHRAIREVGYGIRDTWIDPAEAVPEMAPTTLEEETVWIMEEEAYAAREAWAHSIGLSQTVHHELQTLREQVSKDETPEVLIDFLRLVQRGLQAQVRVVRTNKGTEFLNQTLHAYFAAEGILHQTSVARTPEQNGVVKRRNRTLVEAARTMLSAAKVPLFFWAEAIVTACFTQNRSLVIPRQEKTPYHIINDRKPSVKFFHIFGFVCYIVKDGENLDKMKEKGDECIFVGYSTQSRAYKVFNKRTRVIMESIHVNFDKLPKMASDQLSSDLAPECQTMALNHDSLSPENQRQANVPQADRTVTTSNELDLLFSPIFDELLNGSSKVVSKSSAVSATDDPLQCQNLTTLLNIHTTPAPTCQVPSLAPTVSSSENINQAKTYAENDQVADDEFINIFSTSVQDQRETSSCHVDSLNMHTFYQRYPSEHRWIKDHPLEQVIGNPSQSVRTRRQLELDAEMCMFALLHQFDRLDVWELVDRPLCTNVFNLKWLWKYKRDEENIVIRNKSHLVAKGYA
nr:hypothetical protein [Tanacetum cinerariifolium]